MMTLSEMVARLDEMAPFDKAAGWDEVGLQVGDPTADVETVAVCHEVNDDVLDAVRNAGVDLLVTYHPLLFRATTRLVAGPSPSGRAFALAKARCGLVAVHTAFDVAPGGTADALAGSLGLVDPTGFGPAESAPLAKVVAYVPVEASEAVRRAMAMAGGGSIGHYDACSFESVGTGRWMADSAALPSIGQPGEEGSASEVRVEMLAARPRVGAVVAALVAAHPYEEPAFDVTEVTGYQGMIGRVGEVAATTLGALVALVRHQLRVPAIRQAGSDDRGVRRVAVLPGSGSDFVADALAAGADVLVTGDVSHHRAVEALDRGLALVDAGHAPTERPGMAALVTAVADLGVSTLDLTAITTDPWDRGSAGTGSLAGPTVSEGR